MAIVFIFSITFLPCQFDARLKASCTFTDEILCKLLGVLFFVSWSIAKPISSEKGLTDDGSSYNKHMMMMTCHVINICKVGANLGRRA